MAVIRDTLYLFYDVNVVNCSPEIGDIRKFVTNQVLTRV